MKRSTWILLAVVALLASFIALWERKQPSTEEIAKERNRLVDFKPGQVRQLSRSGQGAVSLVKEKGGAWRLTQPVDDTADRYGVEGFLDRLSNATVLRWVEPAASEAQLGLSPPRAVWTLKGPTKPVVLEVGAKAPLNQGLYVRIAGRTALVAPDLESLLLEPVSSLRSKDLLTVGTADIQSLKVVRGGAETLALSRDPTGGWTVTAPFSDRGDSDRIENLLDDISLCPVDQYVSDKPADLSAYGLDPPSTDILVTAKGQTIEAKLGKAVPGGAPEKRLVYAWVSNRPSVMAVSLNSLKSLDQDPEKLRSMSLIPHDFYDVQEIGVSGLYTLALRRDEKLGWVFTQPKLPPKGAQASILADGLSSLRGERAVPLTEPGALGLSPPALTITFQGKGFSDRVELGRDSSGTWYAHPAKRSVALVLPEQAWGKIVASFTLVKGAAKAGPK